MPKVDANVTRALVVKWLVREGDSVEVGAPLVEVETEKAVFEIEAAESGTVQHICASEGQRVPVGTVLGVIGMTPSLSRAVPSIVSTSRDSASVGGVSPEYIVEDYSDALLGE